VNPPVEELALSRDSESPRCKSTIRMRMVLLLYINRIGQSMSYQWSGVRSMSHYFHDEEEAKMITVLNMDGRQLTPCLPHRAWREVERSRAVWIDEQTIKLLYNPFLFRDYRKVALKRDHHTCLWCGLPATTVDHIIPSSKGGLDLPQNLMASCSDCNTKRGNRSAFAYFKEKIRFVPHPIKLCLRILRAIYSHR